MAKHDFTPAQNDFNGAAEFKPRKYIDGANQAYPIDDFNGAAEFKPRKLYSRSRMSTVGSTLQWGRGI